MSQKQTQGFSDPKTILAIILTFVIFLGWQMYLGKKYPDAYKKKDWGHLIAPTNRRPFGFAWEDWGRLDALEVLANAKSIYKPNSKKIYLTFPAIQLLHIPKKSNL